MSVVIVSVTETDKMKLKKVFVVYVNSKYIVQLWNLSSWPWRVLSKKIFKLPSRAAIWAVGVYEMLIISRQDVNVGVK